MNLDPRDLFRGSLIVARRDFAANAKSVRVVVITILTLLAILGAAFGLAGFSASGPGIQNEYVLWAAAAYPASGAGGIVARVTDAFGVPRPDQAVALGDPFNPSDPTAVFHERATGITNASGWVSFPDLGPGLWPLELQVGTYTARASVDLAATSPTDPFQVGIKRFDILNDQTVRDVGLLVVRPDGAPIEGAEVRVNRSLVGMTDVQGYFRVRLDTGLWIVNVTHAGGGWEQAVVVQEPLILLPIFAGPDSLLYFLAVALMGIFGPIVAVAVSYDALAKERMQGSLELLLVRPASRTGLAVGKFLGTFLSVGAPMIGVMLGAIAGVAGIQGRWPDAGFATAFILGTLGLLATYVLIMQIFSTVVKSPGTAILSAIMVWLVFNIIWNLVFLAATAALGIEGGTPEYFTANTLALLFNPTGVYQLTIAAAAPASLTGGGGGGGELPNWIGPVGIVVWIAALLVLAVLLFRKKVV